MASITHVPALLGMSFSRFGGRGGGFALMLLVLVVVLLVAWAFSSPNASARH